MVSSCSTTSGACSATMTSAAFRPANGRVTVLAYAVGEESFNDIDGDGLADLAPVNEMIDANGIPTDMGEAFADFNENGIRDLIPGTLNLEPFVDFNNNAVFDGPDFKYNGTLCNETGTPSGISSPGTCSASKSIDVRRNFPIVFSGSDPVFLFSTPSVNLGNCAPGTSASVVVTITDVNGNIMPQGTSVSFSATNGTITSAPTTFTVPNSTACLANSGPGYSIGPVPAGFTCPASSAVPLGSAPLSYSVSLTSNATLSAPPTVVCTNPITSGSLTVTVSTPKGVVTSASIPVTD
jgi:hypothetical protein